VTAATGGVPSHYECTDKISSMPIGALLRAMDPRPPTDVGTTFNELSRRV
jgi:hypothetical protein